MHRSLSNSYVGVCKSWTDRSPLQNREGQFAKTFARLGWLVSLAATCTVPFLRAMSPQRRIPVMDVVAGTVDRQSVSHRIRQAVVFGDASPTLRSSQQTPRRRLSGFRYRGRCRCRGRWGTIRRVDVGAPDCLEAENLLLGDGDPEVLVEGHPEVCFRALNGTSLEYSKHTAAGVAERLAVLRNVDKYTRGDWRTVARELGSEGHRVGLDDAARCVCTCTHCVCAERGVPSTPIVPPHDAEELPMQMVYRSESELSPE